MGSEAEGGLCYVVPAYMGDQTEHFFHLPALLQRVGKQIPLAVVVERGAAVDGVTSARHIVALGSGAPGRVRRALRFFRAARWLTRLGYRTFFLRYSRMAATILVLLRLRYGIRIFYWMSGQADLVVENSLMHRMRRRLDHWYLRFLIGAVDRIVTGPETMLDYMRRRWHIPTSRLALLYNDIDTRRFRPLSVNERPRLRTGLGVSDEDFLVLSVHRLAVRRGSRLLVPIIEATSQQTGRRLRVIIVGDGPDAPYVHEQIRRSSCADVFDVRGPLPNRDLPALYQAADCFLMPSYEEGFPRVVLEAMATGIPVVATRAGGTQEVLGGDYAYTADPGDVAALASHLTAFERDRALRQKVGKQLRDRAERLYDTRVVADMLIDLVRRSP